MASFVEKKNTVSQQHCCLVCVILYRSDNQPNQSDEWRREEVCQLAEASGSAGLQTATGHRVTATGGEAVQVSPTALPHLLSLPCDARQVRHAYLSFQ